MFSPEAKLLLGFDRRVGGVCQELFGGKTETENSVKCYCKSSVKEVEIWVGNFETKLSYILYGLISAGAQRITLMTSLLQP